MLTRQEKNARVAISIFVAATFCVNGCLDARAFEPVGGDETLIAQKKDTSKKGSDAKKNTGDSKDKSSKKAASKGKDKDKKDEKPKKEPVITNIVNVTPDQLVEKPKNYLGKNIKFKANFFAFSNLALNYKPALRPQKDYISFLVLRPNTHIPYSEIKLAMPIPKDKDKKRNQMLTSLKDGDKVEVIGRVFSTALDEPWVDVLKLKNLTPKKKKKDKKDKGKKAKKDDKNKSK